MKQRRGKCRTVVARLPNVVTRQAINAGASTLRKKGQESPVYAYRHNSRHKRFCPQSDYFMAPDRYFNGDFVTLLTYIKRIEPHLSYIRVDLV
jgi:hypothetical protein